MKRRGKDGQHHLLAMPQPYAGQETLQYKHTTGIPLKLERTPHDDNQCPGYLTLRRDVGVPPERGWRYNSKPNFNLVLVCAGMKRLVAIFHTGLGFVWPCNRNYVSNIFESALLCTDTIWKGSLVKARLYQYTHCDHTVGESSGICILDDL